MRLILIFTSHDKGLQFTALRVLAVPTPNTPISQVDILKDPDFVISPIIKPGGHKRDKYVPTHVSNDSVLRLTWKKLTTAKGTPYNSRQWILRRVTELEKMGWLVKLES